jgi:DnaJ-class molecular chaperone
LSKLKDLKTKTYYEIFNLDRTASTEEIRNAYKDIAKVYHPDSNFFNEIIPRTTDPEDTELFQYITHAYTTIMNPDSREAYDKTLPPILPDWDSEPQPEPLPKFKPKPKPADTAEAEAQPAPTKDAFQEQMNRLRSIQRQRPAPPKKEYILQTAEQLGIQAPIVYVVGAATVTALAMILIMLWIFL